MSPFDLNSASTWMDFTIAIDTSNDYWTSSIEGYSTKRLIIIVIIIAITTTTTVTITTIITAITIRTTVATTIRTIAIAVIIGAIELRLKAWKRAQTSSCWEMAGIGCYLACLENIMIYLALSLALYHRKLCCKYCSFAVELNQLILYFLFPHRSYPYYSSSTFSLLHRTILKSWLPCLGSLWNCLNIFCCSHRNHFQAFYQSLCRVVSLGEQWELFGSRLNESNTLLCVWGV